jgi:hypothetical protein
MWSSNFLVGMEKIKIKKSVNEAALLGAERKPLLNCP